MGGVVVRWKASPLRKWRRRAGRYLLAAGGGGRGLVAVVERLDNGVDADGRLVVAAGWWKKGEGQFGNFDRVGATGLGKEFASMTGGALSQIGWGGGCRRGVGVVSARPSR